LESNTTRGEKRVVIVLMGVAGAGKTTVGSLLARELHWQFADADEFHSPENITKMSAGIPLTDADRAAWLETLRELVAGWIAAKKNAVLACSALKQSYRTILQVDEQVRFVYLKGDRNLFAQRLLQRHDHYMKAQMLESQLLTLEPPMNAIVVDADATPENIVHEIRKHLELTDREGQT
jgi:gluconokinase